MARSYTGGVHPPCRKDRTCSLPIERLPAPKTVVIPLLQHIGATNASLVAVGDRVLLGQKIGESEAAIACPVHASVSGRVTAIEKRAHPNGREVLSVVIENDYADEVHPSIEPKRLEDLSPADLVTWIREAGIVGMGGGGFPTHIKLTPPAGVTLDAVLLNGAECEPYLTTDHRIMVEWAQDVVLGLKCLMKATGVARGFIGIELNKQDAIAELRGAIANDPNISIVPLAVKYPQGAEQQLIAACLGRRVPKGKRPVHIGVIVNNVHTAQAIAASLRTGWPSIERVVTVDGACVERPGNVLVRIGTTFGDILAARGLVGEPHKLLSGGPMMGMAMYTPNVPVCKCTSGILALSRAESPAAEAMTCVRCAACIDACPMLIYPTLIAQYGERGRTEEAEKYGALECHECGACTYVCPSRIPLVQWIRRAKSDIYAERNRGS
ncbi:MAG: electron transport complex subunit RsxC [Selenomonadales bacterium]|nr:electron transport complex subunit RsxC [Selenomonadales bacterium]